MPDDTGDRARGERESDRPADGVPAMPSTWRTDPTTSTGRVRSRPHRATGPETDARDATGRADLAAGEGRRAETGAPVTESGDGVVFLVGAGPGDPGLLTRRAWTLLESADVVLHDSLTGDRIVAEIPASVRVRDVGKRPPDRTSQAEINDLLVERSRAGDRVVRLKGGDPTVFGRGGEEAEYLADAEVPFELVPGVSSVLAAPSAGGIPLTHREKASSVTVITGHETPDKDESALDWAALAATVAAGGTLVILMGVRRLPENVRALCDQGLEPETPVAMVQKATWDEERTVVGTLDDVVERTRAAGIEPPAVTIVGDVVDVHDDVAAWLRD